MSIYSAALQERERRRTIDPAPIIEAGKREIREHFESSEVQEAFRQQMQEEAQRFLEGILSGRVSYDDKTGLLRRQYIDIDSVARGKFERDYASSLALRLLGRHLGNFRDYPEVYQAVDWSLVQFYQAAWGYWNPIWRTRLKDFVTNQIDDPHYKVSIEYAGLGTCVDVIYLCLRYSQKRGKKGARTAKTRRAQKSRRG
jgi:hypothetical protein